jgi:hypothetical protein
VSTETDLFGGLLSVDAGLLAHGSENDNVCRALAVPKSSKQVQLTGVLAILGEHFVDLLADVVVGDLDVVLGGAVIGHEGEETVVSDINLRCAISSDSADDSAGTYELVLLAADVGHIHVVGGGAQLLELLRGEDIDGDQMDLGVAVLASLRGGHLDDLAGTVLDDNEAVLPQGRALERVRHGGTGIGALEGVLMLRATVSGCSTAMRSVAMRPRARRWGRLHMRGPVLGQRTCASSAIVLNES